MGLRTFLKRADGAVQETKTSMSAAVVIAGAALLVATIALLVAVVK